MNNSKKRKIEAGKKSLQASLPAQTRSPQRSAQEVLVAGLVALFEKQAMLVKGTQPKNFFLFFSFSFRFLILRILVGAFWQELLRARLGL